MRTRDRHTHQSSNGAVSVAAAGEGINVRPVDRDAGLDEVHRRFGGIDIPAVLAGMLCALGAAVLLGGLAAAAGTVGYQQGVRRDTDEVSVGGFIAGLVVLLIAFGIGGWVAGRMARYDGARNGFSTAVTFIVLAAIVAVLGVWLGDRYDFFDAVNLPQWFTDRADTLTGVVTAVISIAVMVIAATIGGKLGERYHRHADDALLSQRAGGITATTTRTMPAPEHRS